MEDAASVAQTPACLGSSIHPAQCCLAGPPNQNPQFKSRPGKFIAYALLINLRKLKSKTLGHDWSPIIVRATTAQYCNRNHPRQSAIRLPFALKASILVSI
jgi:hypothetical protein